MGGAARMAPMGDKGDEPVISVLRGANGLLGADFTDSGFCICVVEEDFEVGGDAPALLLRIGKIGREAALTAAHVRALLPLLEHFANNGRLPAPSSDAPQRPSYWERSAGADDE